MMRSAKSVGSVVTAAFYRRPWRVLPASAGQVTVRSWRRRLTGRHPESDHYFSLATGQNRARAKLSAISGTRDPIDQNLRLLSRYPSDQCVCTDEELINIKSAGVAYFY